MKLLKPIILIFLLQSYFTEVIRANSVIQFPDTLSEQMKNTGSEIQKIDLLNTYAKKVYIREFDKSLVVIDSSLKWSQRIKYKKGEADAKKILGLIYYYKGDYEEAAKSMIDALKIFELSADVPGQADVCIELGNLMRKHDDLNSAIRYFTRAKELYASINDIGGLSNIQNNIGIIYEYQGELDSAMNHYNMALAGYTSINDSTGMGYSYDYIGLVHAYRNEYLEAKNALMKGYNIRVKRGERQAIAVSLVNLGELSLSVNKNTEAISYFKQSLNIADSMNFAELISYNNKMLAEASGRSGKYKDAFAYHQKYFTLNDSLFNLKRNEQIAEIQARYETEKREKENVILQKANQEKELRISQQKIQLAILSGVLLIGIFVALLLYNRNKLIQQKQLNEEIQRQEKLRLKAIIDSQEEERRRIAAELHDGLGQVLSAARVNLAAADVERSSHPQVNQALELIDRSCKELREISHNMMPSLLLKKGLVPAIQEMTAEINNVGVLNIFVEEVGITKRLDPETEIHLFRIIQELISNILKYANASEVQIQLIEENNFLTLMVEDNGIGFDKNMLNENSGNGWYNIQSRLKLINGDVEIDSRQGNGTVVTIELTVNSDQ